VASHQKFKQKYGLPFKLLADVDSKLCDAFGVIVERVTDGKSTKGIVRSTFVFDRSGRIIHVWPKVEVAGHAQDVLAHIT